MLSRSSFSRNLNLIRKWLMNMDSVGAKREAADEPDKRPEKAAKGNSDSASSSAATHQFSLLSGAFGHKGMKATLEDVEVQVHDLCAYSASLHGVRAAFYAVFDGHAGRNAADFCAENMARCIAVRIQKPLDNENVRAAIRDGFRETGSSSGSPAARTRRHSIAMSLQYDVPVFPLTSLRMICHADKLFLGLAAEKGWTDGCTAVTVTVINDVCFVGWVGDSKAILVRRETDADDARLKILELTSDHTCIKAKERERIVKAGGFVQDNRVNGIMEVTRSIGDAALKKAGVSSTPELQRVTLCARDEFLLLACDGLWAVFDKDDACQKAFKGLQAGIEPQEVAMSLVREAIRGRQAHDNVSAMIVRVRTRDDARPQ